MGATDKIIIKYLGFLFSTGNLETTMMLSLHTDFDDFCAHVDRICQTKRKNKIENKSNSKYCNFCKMTGHEDQNCYKKKGEKNDNKNSTP